MPTVDYTQVYDNYDKAFLRWARSVLKYRGKTLLMVFASPERAFAQVAKALRIPENALDTVPLPFASIERLSEEFDPQRFNGTYMGNVAVSRDWEHWYSMRRPVPYNYLFQITLWSRNKSELDEFCTQVALSLYSNYFYLDVIHPEIPTPNLEGVTTLNVFTKHTGTTEGSDLEPGREQRVMKRMLNFDVQGWKCYEKDETGVVRSIRIEVRDMDTEVLLDVDTYVGEIEE